MLTRSPFFLAGCKIGATGGGGDIPLVEDETAGDELSLRPFACAPRSRAAWLRGTEDLSIAAAAAPKAKWSRF